MNMSCIIIKDINSVDCTTPLSNSELHSIVGGWLLGLPKLNQFINTIVYQSIKLAKASSGQVNYTNITVRH